MENTLEFQLVKERCARLEKELEAAVFARDELRLELVRKLETLASTEAQVAHLMARVADRERQCDLHQRGAYARVEKVEAQLFKASSIAASLTTCRVGCPTLEALRAVFSR